MFALSAGSIWVGSNDLGRTMGAKEQLGNFGSKVDWMRAEVVYLFTAEAAGRSR